MGTSAKQSWTPMSDAQMKASNLLPVLQFAQMARRFAGIAAGAGPARAQTQLVAGELATLGSKTQQAQSPVRVSANACRDFVEQQVVSFPKTTYSLGELEPDVAKAMVELVESTRQAAVITQQDIDAVTARETGAQGRINHKRLLGTALTKVELVD